MVIEWPSVRCGRENYGRTALEVLLITSRAGSEQHSRLSLKVLLCAPPEPRLKDRQGIGARRESDVTGSPDEDSIARASARQWLNRRLAQESEIRSVPPE
jgi:hypothetical protein